MAKVRTNFKPPKPRHFIRQWRKHRGLTQEQLAEIVGVTHGAISQLERGETGYTQPMLEALAGAMHCEPADLIMRDPTQVGAPWSIWEALKPAEREKALDYMRFLQQQVDGPKGGKAA
ncbi:helix-turn-helix domain-containing protein [Ancylobacter sp. IITR112]|uniref:helix-turn-helix domain-containing protein n=1 Tax=Ancylobacter sp. IITR112 TaxID=3138073 RepID=UPI00352BC053